MQSNVVFSISEGMIKFLQVTGAQKKVVTGADAINISGQNDLDPALPGHFALYGVSFA